MVRVPSAYSDTFFLPQGCHCKWGSMYLSIYIYFTKKLQCPSNLCIDPEWSSYLFAGSTRFLQVIYSVFFKKFVAHLQLTESGKCKEHMIIIFSHHSITFFTMIKICHRNIIQHPFLRMEGDQCRSVLVQCIVVASVAISVFFSAEQATSFLLLNSSPWG